MSSYGDLAREVAYATCTWRAKWYVLFMAFDFSPSSSLVAVQALLDQAHEIQGAGDLAASDTDALKAYRRASGIAENSALSSENITIVLAQAEPSLAAYPAATRSLSASATASVNEAGQTSDRRIAQQAASAAIRAAESNRDLAKEAIGKATQPSRVALGAVGWVLALGAIAGGVWWLVHPKPQARRFPAR